MQNINFLYCYDDGMIMGLFKTNFVEKIRSLEQGLSHLDVNARPGAAFYSTIQKIQKYDIECIRLVRQLAHEGHLPEKFKKLLVTQFLVLLRKVEGMKVDNPTLLKKVKAEMEEFLMVELTAEKIGIQVNRSLYHGSPVPDIHKFNPYLVDYGGMDTLGGGIYTTDYRKMAINYAFYRYNRNMKGIGKPPIPLQKLRPTVYTLKYKKNQNFIADLSEPRKIRALYNQLKEFLEQEKPKKNWVIGARMGMLISHLENIIRNQTLFRSLGSLLLGDRNKNYSETIYDIADFLKKIGYRGLRSGEGGEPKSFQSFAVYPWKPSMSYVIFNPDDVQIVSEEHFKWVKGIVVTD